jgi:predicted ATP-dependent Lon-type protease
MSICVCPCTIVVSARVGKTEQIKDGDRAVRQQAILDEAWTSKIHGLVPGWQILAARLSKRLTRTRSVSKIHLSI